MKKVFSNEVQTDIEKQTREQQEKLSVVSTAIEVAKRDIELLEKAKSALEVEAVNVSNLVIEEKKRYLEIRGDIEIALIELDKARKEEREMQEQVVMRKEEDSMVANEIEERKVARHNLDMEIDSLTIKRSSFSAELKRIEDEIALALVQEKHVNEVMLARNGEIASRNSELSLILREVDVVKKSLEQMLAQKVEFERIIEQARLRKNTELDKMELAIKEHDDVSNKLWHEKAQYEHIIEKRNRAEEEMRTFVESKERLINVIAEQTDYLKKLKHDNEIKQELGL